MGQTGRTTSRAASRPSQSRSAWRSSACRFCASRSATPRLIVRSGIIYNASTDQLVTAREGNGAFMNGERLPLSHPHPLPLADMGDAVVMVEAGAYRDKAVLDPRVDSWKHLLADPRDDPRGIKVRGLRACGCTVWSYCLVAAGQVDCHYNYSCCSYRSCRATDLDRGLGRVCGRHRASRLAVASLTDRSVARPEHDAMARAAGPLMRTR